MLGELIEIVKFLLEVLKGNVPGSQLYAMLGIVSIVVVAEVVYETRKGKYKLFNLFIERFFLNAIGIIFYMSFYLFGLKLIMKVLPSVITNYSTELGSWLAIISYLSIILLAPFAIYINKSKNLMTKIGGAVAHAIVTGALIYLMNSYWNPNVEFPTFLLILNVLVNTILSFVIIVYGTATDNEEKSKPKSRATETKFN